MSKLLFLIKLPGIFNFIEKGTLAQIFCCEFYEIFKNAFFAEQLRVTASGIRMQVVVIYSLNLSC